MECRKILGVFIILMIGLALNAETGADILNRIKRHYSGVTTMKAEFTQMNTWPSIKTTKVSRGTIKYNQNALLLDYSDPKGQKLGIEGRKVTMLDPIQKQALVSSVSSVIAGIKPIEIVNHYSNGAKLETRKTSKGNALIIHPAKANELRVIEVISNTAGSIQNISYEDASGNRVDYSFSGIQENTSVSGLKVTIPEGYNIINN